MLATDKTSGQVAYEAYIGTRTMNLEGRNAPIPYTYVSWLGLSIDMRIVWEEIAEAVRAHNAQLRAIDPEYH